MSNALNSELDYYQKIAQTQLDMLVVMQSALAEIAKMERSLNGSLKMSQKAESALVTVESLAVQIRGEKGNA